MFWRGLLECKNTLKEAGHYSEYTYIPYIPTCWITGLSVCILATYKQEREWWNTSVWFYSNQTNKHNRAEHYISTTDTVNLSCTQKFVIGKLVWEPEQIVLFYRDIDMKAQGEEKWSCGNFHSWHMSCGTTTEICLVRVYQLSTLKLRLYNCFIASEVIHLFTESPTEANPERFEGLSNGCSLSYLF